jgi:hypothetical protein
VKPGTSKIAGTFRFQECNDSICKLPQEVSFEIPIKIEAMVPGLKN